MEDDDISTSTAEDAHVLVYPNPVSTQMQVQMVTKGEVVVLSIVDLNGRILSVNTFATHSGLNLLKVNTEDLSNGFYMLQILKGETKIAKRIVVQD